MRIGDSRVHEHIGGREKVGDVSVHYTERMPNADEGPFLKEERRLINAIAERIGYPVLVRPSYVLGGRGMEIVYDEEDLRALEVFAENAGTCIRQAERAEWMRQTIERMHRGSSRGKADALETVPVVVDP